MQSHDYLQSVFVSSIKWDTSTTSRSHFAQELCPWAYLHSKRPWVTFRLRHGVILSPLSHNSYSLSTGCEKLLSAVTLTCTHIHHSSLALSLPQSLCLFFPSWASTFPHLLHLCLSQYVWWCLASSSTLIGSAGIFSFSFICTLPLFSFFFISFALPLSHLLGLWSPVHVEVRTGEMEMSQYA